MIYQYSMFEPAQGINLWLIFSNVSKILEYIFRTLKDSYYKFCREWNFGESHTKCYYKSCKSLRIHVYICFWVKGEYIKLIIFTISWSTKEVTSMILYGVPVKYRHNKPSVMSYTISANRRVFIAAHKPKRTSSNFFLSSHVGLFWFSKLISICGETFSPCCLHSADSRVGVTSLI